MAAMDGCESPVQDFRPADFDNGYTRTKNGNFLPDAFWQNQVFAKIPDAVVPTQATSFFVEYMWNKDFINKQGQSAVDNRAIFKQYYIPSSSAIVVSDMRSPVNQVKDRLKNAGQPIPSSREIADRFVPPLNRWSDVTWTVWKEKGGQGNNLRYIAHDFVANRETEHVMEEILEYKQPEWPGRSFGMDSDEGRALLGTPNGIGVARILIDRASTMGRRDIRFYIFYAEEDYPCMLIDMKPVQTHSRRVRKLKPDFWVSKL
ncbi:MAG: hypothetical protein Q9224_007312 [Gallowayella concinna]